MSPDVVQIALLGVNTLLVPAVLSVGRYLWRVERRLLKIEMKMGVKDE